LFTSHRVQNEAHLILEVLDHLMKTWGGGIMLSLLDNPTLRSPLDNPTLPYASPLDTPTLPYASPLDNPTLPYASPLEKAGTKKAGTQKYNLS